MDLETVRQNTTATILRFSVPAIVAMLLTSLITVFLSIGLMVSVGGAALAQIAFGAGDRSACCQVFRQTVATTVVFAVLTGAAVALFFEPMLDILGAQGQVREYFKSYYVILLPELILMVVNSCLGMFIRGEGNPQFFMKVNVVSVLLNVVLDDVFAAVLHVGIAGIAVASLLSAAVSFGCLLYYFIKKATVYRLGAFSFSAAVCVKTLLNGSSEFIGEMSTGIAMFAYNFVIMRRIGVDGVTAFTIVGYVSYVFSMVVVGFGQGVSPLVSFCFGAKEGGLARRLRRRTNRLVYCSWKCACVCADFPVAGVCGAACLYFCASCVFWHDGRVACRAGDGGGDDGALRGVGAAK